MSKIALSWKLTFLMSCFALLLLAAPTAAQAQGKPAECLPSDVLLVVDHSGSMATSNKWRDAQSAFNQLLTNFATKLRFGLITFSSAAKLQVQVGPNTANQVKSVLNSVGPTGSTAMKCALQESFKHYQSTVIPRDTVKDRRRFVVLITDGTPNTCGTDVIPEVARMRLINVAGRNYDVKTFVIGFGTGVNAAQLQGMAVAGGTGQYYQANNLASLKKALDAIGNGTSKEICDNKDNDCNGIIDEFKESCQGACGAGTRLCSKGKWSQCSSAKAPEKEICDNKDNDCDGQIDNNIPDRDCSSACGKGQEKCVAGKWTGCTAPKIQKEICNGRDDNCNGQIDENLRQACKTACGAGTQACIQGDWNTCSAASPSPEICDGLDNDCNGQADDNLAPGVCSGQCVNGKCQPKCRAGECIGNKLCVNGFCVEKPCEPKCVAGETCRSGKCVPADCTQPGGACTGTDLCVNKTCITDPCQGVKCNKDQFCRGGQCIHSCALVQCPAGNICKNGACQAVPCGGSCQNGTSCVNGKCMPNACSGCANGQTCQGTSCVQDRCLGVKCASGQKCFEGECYGPNGPGTTPGPTPDGGNNTPDGGGNTTDGGGNTTDGGGNNGGDGSGNTNQNDGAIGVDGNNGGNNGNGNGNGVGGPNGRGGGGCLCTANPGLPPFSFGFMLLLFLVPMLRRKK